MILSKYCWLFRKKAASRLEALGRCFAARRLPKSELSTLILPTVTQFFPRGVPRGLGGLLEFADSGHYATKVKTMSPVRQSEEVKDFALLQEMEGGEESGTVEEAEEDFLIEED